MRIFQGWNENFFGFGMLAFPRPGKGLIFSSRFPSILHLFHLLLSLSLPARSRTPNFRSSLPLLSFFFFFFYFNVNISLFFGWFFWQVFNENLFQISISLNLLPRPLKCNFFALGVMVRLSVLFSFRLLLHLSKKRSVILAKPVFNWSSK